MSKNSKFSFPISNYNLICIGYVKIYYDCNNFQSYMPGDRLISYGRLYVTI